MSAPTITRSAHPSALWPGVKAWFGQTYDELPAEWSQIFSMETSDKAYEEVVEATGFGLAPVKPEAASIQYDTDSEGYKSRFTHFVYGLGYIVTREALDDNQYEVLSRRRARSLAFSMRQTTEIVHANVLNRGFSSSYLGGDGVALFSASHPTSGGLQSNLLTAADLSEASLEDGLKRIAQTRNARGLNIASRARRLIVSSDDMFNAERIVNSNLRSGTANNDVNAVKAMGLLPGGVVVNHYLTDPDAWFIQTDIDSGLMSFWRRKPELEKDSDFDTENAKAKSTMRFSCGWADWRSLYGASGS